MPFISSSKGPSCLGRARGRQVACYSLPPAERSRGAEKGAHVEHCAEPATAPERTRVPAVLLLYLFTAYETIRAVPESILPSCTNGVQEALLQLKKYLMWAPLLSLQLLQYAPEPLFCFKYM